jgi:two-component system nitrate/nitrite response regulator NarL
MPIRIVLADDHPIVLDGLAQLFAVDPDFDVVTRCTDGLQAASAIRRARPDVAVLDVRMPGRSGLEVLRELRHEQVPTRIVLLTAAVSDDEVLDAVRLGVAGIVMKDAAPRQLVQCVRTVARGEQFLDDAAVRKALDRLLRREAGLAQNTLLTPRELEIVRMVAAGLRNRQIAEKLSITEGTVKIHLHSIYEKVGVSGRVELSNYARDHSLV